MNQCKVPPAPSIAYGEHPDQVGNLHLPGREGGPWPCVVLLHGGFWRVGWDRTLMTLLADDLARRGIAAWNVEYRRVGDVGGGWPGTGEDVARAIGFVDKLPVARESVVLVGHSAGGQLALWAAKRARLPVVALAAVSDVRETVARSGPDGVPARFVGRSRFDELSPIELLPLGVRQILFHGTADDSVPYTMSERYVEAAGEEAELVTLEGAGHFEPIDPEAREWPQVLAAVRELCVAADQRVR